jgi:hypothetical protein
MFPMFGILSKIGFKDLKNELTPEKVKKLSSMFDQKEGEAGKTGEVETYIGFNVILNFVEIILKNLPYCENEIYKFLSGLSGMSENDIKNLDMATFTEMLIDVVQKEEFKDFFKVVSKLFK